jgi:hypothetical protein
VTVTGFVTQINGKNKATLKLTCGGSPEQFSVAVGEVAYQKIIEADPNTTMAMEAVLADKLETATRSMTLSTGYATLDLLKGGKGIAFGKSATREGFECAMPAYFTGGISGAEPAFESSGNPGCYIRTVGGETEWLNPPMVPGVEYRTPERWLGKPVYAMVKEMGALINGLSTTFTNADPHGAVRMRASVGGYVTPFWINGILQTSVSAEPAADGVAVTLYSQGTLNGIGTTVCLWYTKTSNHKNNAIAGQAIAGIAVVGKG